MKTSTGIIIFLIGIIGGLLFLHSNLIKRYEEKSSQIEYKTVYVENRDTVYFEKPIIRWKTKTKTDTIFLNNSSNALRSDSFVIYQQKEKNAPKETICNEEEFYFSTFHKDSVIIAEIYVEGRGVPTKTFIDSISMDYKLTYPKTEIIVEKKKCCWLKRLFCGCD